MPGPMPQKSDAQLRKERLGFYREEMSEINATLRGFLQRAKASGACLVDKDGHLITREDAWASHEEGHPVQHGVRRGGKRQSVPAANLVAGAVFTVISLAAIFAIV